MDEIKVDAASDKDWGILEKHAPDATFVSARCVLELRDRVAALETAAKSAAAPTGKANPQWLGGVAVPNSDGWIVTQLQSCAAAPAGGVTVEELAYILSEAPSGDLGMAYWLLKHRRIGPLLRGEGAPAPKRVVLSRRPPEVSTPLYWNSFVSTHGVAWQEGHAAGWAALYAELERQQQGGQADG